MVFNMNKEWHPVVFPKGNITEIDIAILKKEFSMAALMLRKQSSLTQKEVSDASGLSVQCISDIEGDGNPTLNSIVRYLNCFGYEISFKKKIN